MSATHMARKTFRAVCGLVHVRVRVHVCARACVCVRDANGRESASPVHQPTQVLFSTGDMGDKGQKGGVGRHGKIGPIGSKGISDGSLPCVPSQALVPGAPGARLTGLGWWSWLFLCVSLLVIDSVPCLCSGSGQRSLLAWPEQLSPPVPQTCTPWSGVGSWWVTLGRHLPQQLNHWRGGGRARRHCPPQTVPNRVCLTTSRDPHGPAMDGRVGTGAQGRSGPTPNLAAPLPALKCSWQTPPQPQFVPRPCWAPGGTAGRRQ